MLHRMNEETFKADLHCHSTCSDGSLSPAEIIALAQDTGLQGLSITDHDTVEAYPLIFASLQNADIMVIPGVEFSTRFKENSVHVLGYAFDYTHPALLDLCQKHKTRRYDRNRQILEKLNREGCKITQEELDNQAEGTTGRPHIAALMVAKGYVKDVTTAFHKYLGDGKKCYVAGYNMSVEETLDVIHAAKGLAFLAHPHLHKNPKLIRKILELPFDGMECTYANMSKEQNAPWLELAKSKNLRISGGSDFHGTAKPTIQLGCTSVGWAEFEPLWTHYKAHAL